MFSPSLSSGIAKQDPLPFPLFGPSSGLATVSPSFEPGCSVPPSPTLPEHGALPMSTLTLLSPRTQSPDPTPSHALGAGEHVHETLRPSELLAPSRKPPSLFHLSLNVLLRPEVLAAAAAHFPTTLPWHLYQYLLYVLPYFVQPSETMAAHWEPTYLEHLNWSNTRWDPQWMQQQLHRPQCVQSLDVSFAQVPTFPTVPTLAYLNLSGAYPMHAQAFLNLPRAFPALVCLELNHCHWLHTQHLTNIDWTKVWQRMKLLSMQCSCFTQKELKWIGRFFKQVRPTLELLT